MTLIEPTAGRGALDDWSSIDWPAAERNVRRLQERIFRASQNGERAQVKNLQRLLVRSRSAKLLAIRRVTQINRGKMTPGIDGVVCPGPSSRLAMFSLGPRESDDVICLSTWLAGQSERVCDLMFLAMLETDRHAGDDLAGSSCSSSRARA